MSHKRTRGMNTTHALKPVVTACQSQTTRPMRRSIKRGFVDAFESGEIPQAQRAIAAARNSHGACGVARDGRYFAHVTLQRGYTLPFFGLPQDNAAVGAAAQQNVARAGERKGVHGAFVAEQRAPFNQLLGIKHVDNFVVAA